MEANQESIKRWINKQYVVYLHTTEYYSVLKCKETLTYTIIWMNLKDIMLSKINYSQRQIRNDSTYMIYLVKIIETESTHCLLFCLKNSPKRKLCIMWVQLWEFSECYLPHKKQKSTFILFLCKICCYNWLLRY